MEHAPYGIALTRLVFLTENMPEAAASFARLAPSLLEMVPAGFLRNPQYTGKPSNGQSRSPTRNASY